MAGAMTGQVTALVAVWLYATVAVAAALVVTLGALAVARWRRG